MISPQHRIFVRSQSSVGLPSSVFERPRLVHMVTSHLSAGLMRGQLRYLRECGFDVTIVSSPGKGLDEVRELDAVKACAAPIEREISPWSDLVSLFRLWCLLRRLRPVITNVSTPKAGLLGGLAAWLNRVPCRVYTLRGLRCETGKGPKRGALILAERVACRCAHRVVCVSESLRQKAIALGLVDAARTVVLNSGSSNGTDPNRFAPTAERLEEAGELRKELNIPADAPVLGFVGRFTRDKGLCELIESFAQLQQQLPTLVLLLIGDFDEADPLPDRVRKTISTDPQIIWVGLVRDTAAYYHLMDVLAVPTYREGFPNVVLEAHAAGKPVVGTSVTGVVDAIVDGVTGILVSVGNAEKLTAACILLFEDEKLRERMGRAGRDRVLREFKRELIWSALEQEYMKLLANKGLASSFVWKRQTAQRANSRASIAPR
jgi:glycosyltransferase involved in cell wall biosynthesis